ncbi:hypothetical protein XAP412_530077 [Xanthomonas phaseoli pv. phaseoli]|uniref:Uncharacterized protein n=1 Tax=Xanthomonas campestris pv. phaseoli TaxID=317013 RepID=A0AB38E337_XANCH|nr:hypothetical protein XAP6984_580078 [Xanthomonas phaseoli pv. phaseoli]SON87468.1 hypothetical protein XAP412_530077 [Xanthomonas phaseoli pv. phaseoli]SON91267.1 hypothetical protein XAP7430_540079 [Xanthomonas phaseoli pv. phaseoli]
MLGVEMQRNLPQSQIKNNQRNGFDGPLSLDEHAAWTQRSTLYFWHRWSAVSRGCQAY